MLCRIPVIASILILSGLFVIFTSTDSWGAFQSEPSKIFLILPFVLILLVTIFISKKAKKLLPNTQTIETELSVNDIKNRIIHKLLPHGFVVTDLPPEKCATCN